MLTLSPWQRLTSAALCLLRERERRLPRLAWQVWQAGYCVAERLILAQLQQAAGYSGSLA